MPIVDMLEVTARGLRERGFARIALFGTRFTIETGLFGRLDAFDVIPPRPQEIDEIHRVYSELVETGHTAGFPAFDCAYAHINAILEQATPRRSSVHRGLAAG